LAGKANQEQARRSIRSKPSSDKSKAVVLSAPVRVRARTGRREDLNDLIADIYDAALEPKHWNHAAARIAERLGARSAAVALFDTKTGVCHRIADYRIDPKLWKPYEDYYSRIDLWNAALTRVPTGQPYLGEMLVSEHELLRSEIYNDHYRHCQMAYALGGLPLREGRHAFLFGLQRPRSRTAFSMEDHALLIRLFPHLIRAAQIHLRLRNLERRLSTHAHVLDRLPTGVVVVDASGRVVFANTSAEAVIAQKDGLSVVRGELTASSPGEAAKLRRLIAGAARTASGEGQQAGGAIAVSRPSMRRPYALLASPLPAPGENGIWDFGRRHPACVVFVCDPEQRSVMPWRLASQAYGLTPAEARLAVALAGELSLKRAADGLGITEGTARQYLKRVFHKTETRSQADLVRLIVTGPACRQF
jgi:DNA-binding CsgD family transcriptional regulator/PAS domain-containing protein